MARRLLALAGLFCMLLHAGLVVVHHAAPGNRAPTVTASGPSALNASELAQALMASMCRPAGLAGREGAPSAPSFPDEQKAPCVICCCPAAAALLQPFPIRCPHPSLEPMPERIAWQARQILIRARIAERPPVRGPPFAA